MGFVWQVLRHILCLPLLWRCCGSSLDKQVSQLTEQVKKLEEAIGKARKQKETSLKAELDKQSAQLKDLISRLEQQAAQPKDVMSRLELKGDALKTELLGHAKEAIKQLELKRGRSKK